METKKAGDEIRTRDSLLGRQEPPISPLASSKTALQADRTLVKQMCAELTEDVPYTSGQAFKGHCYFLSLLPSQLALF